MTKKTTRPARSLTTAELATAAGGYTLTVSYDLTSYFSTLENASKPYDDVTTSTITNIK